MNELNWEAAPHDSDFFVDGCFRKWANGQEYLFSSNSKKWEECVISWSLERHETNLSPIETRPDPWKEGEERMKAIGPNGNEGEHYEQVKRPVVEIDNNNKYSRKIKSISVGGQIFDIYVDVYDVLEAFESANSASEHSVKKLLKPGGRGAKTVIQDLKEARDSINRSIELEEAK
jgi:hypothetical protein